MAGSQNAVELLKQAQNLGFVDFTTSLVRGVFDVVVQSQIDQLKAFSELVSQVSKTIAEYQQEVTGIDFAKPASDNAVSPKLENYIKEVLNFDLTTATSGKFSLDEQEYKLLENHFGDQLDDDPSKITLPVGTADGDIDVGYLKGLVYDKLKGESRQQYDLLVQVLRLGFARLDVTAGHVQTGMRLSVTGLDEDTSTSYATDTRASGWHAGGYVRGVFKKIGFGVSGGYTASRLRVNVSSDRSISRTTAEGSMTGEVRIDFATSFFEPPPAVATA